MTRAEIYERALARRAAKKAARALAHIERGVNLLSDVALDVRHSPTYWSRKAFYKAVSEINEGAYALDNIAHAAKTRIRASKI